MATSALKIEAAIALCKRRADEYRDTAKRYAASHNRELQLQYEGMALAADRLADEMAQQDRRHRNIPDHEIEALARDIDGSSFARFEAMVARLKSAGQDDFAAQRSAEQTYGPALAQARQRARNELEEQDDEAIDEHAYGMGFDIAVRWHEEMARHSEMLESQEKDGHRKAVLHQRAERHKLYARQLREVFEAEKRNMNHPKRRNADNKQHDLPLEVQMMFLKRTDNVAGEAFD